MKLTNSNLIFPLASLILFVVLQRIHFFESLYLTGIFAIVAGWLVTRLARSAGERAEENAAKLVVLNRELQDEKVRYAELNTKLERDNEELSIRNHVMEETSENLRATSTIDQLTGLYNRRYLDLMTMSKFNRSRNRNGVVIAALMLDLDHFKLVNDTYGHGAGDVVLAGVGRIIKNSLDPKTLAGRYGGEEFFIVIDGYDYVAARDIAEIIRSRIKEEKFIFRDIEIRIAVSIGIVSHPETVVENDRDFVHKADEALYRAKESGRDRVVARNEF